VLARQGDAWAIGKLHGPDRPRALGYLLDWLYQLHGRSGMGMDGPAPLSYGAIADWSRLTGNEPDADEVDALMELDMVMLTVGRAKPSTPTPTDDRPKRTRRGAP
jgi:hypothetical protein